MSIIPAPGGAKNSATHNDAGRASEGPESVFYCHRPDRDVHLMMSPHIMTAAHLERSIA